VPSPGISKRRNPADFPQGFLIELVKGGAALLHASLQFLGGLFKGIAGGVVFRPGSGGAEVGGGTLALIDGALHQAAHITHWITSHRLSLTCTEKMISCISGIRKEGISATAANNNSQNQSCNF
jgi:hypothetical protein